MTYTITLKNRTPELIDSVATYFEALGSVTAFEFTIPNDFSGDGKEVVNVITQEFDVIEEQVNAKTLRATLKRVYDKIPPSL